MKATVIAGVFAAAAPMAILRTLQTAKTPVNARIRPDAHIGREFLVGGNPIGITEAFDNAFLYTDVGPASLIGKISFGGHVTGTIGTTTLNSARTRSQKGPTATTGSSNLIPATLRA